MLIPPAWMKSSISRRLHLQVAFPTQDHPSRRMESPKAQLEVLEGLVVEMVYRSTWKTEPPASSSCLYNRFCEAVFSVFCGSDRSQRQRAVIWHKLTMLAGATLPKEEVTQGRGGQVAGTDTRTMRLLPCRNHCLEALALLLRSSLAYGMEMVDGDRRR